MDQQQSTPDQYQYIKMPDGSYGKFASGASDDEIRGHIQQDFPNAFKAPDERNSMQKSFDENTTPNPKEPLLETGLKSVVHAIGSPFVHPVETLKGMAKSIPTSPADAPRVAGEMWSQNMQKVLTTTTKKVDYLTLPRRWLETPLAT